MFKKLKKIISIMTEKDLSELKEEYGKYSYQWIKGDNLSMTQHYSDIVEEGDKRYIIFTDKSRISLDLLDEYMIKVERGFEEGIKLNLNSIETIKETVQVEEDFTRNKGVKTRDISYESIGVKSSDSPIFSLLSKQKENWVDVDLKLTINLPPKSLWDVLMGSFDDAEKDILEYVTKDLDIEVVRQSLRESIKEIYKKNKSIPLKNVRSQDSISE
jgi:hypothetical protein